MFFLGFQFRPSDAVYPDHILAEPGYLFIGHGTAYAFAYSAMATGKIDGLFDAIQESLTTRRSVKIELEKV